MSKSDGTKFLREARCLRPLEWLTPLLSCFVRKLTADAVAALAEGYNEAPWERDTAGVDRCECGGNMPSQRSVKTPKSNWTHFTRYS